jgi:hypothetical protein
VLFELCEAGGRPAAESFEHLAECSAAFIQARSRVFITGLRPLVTDGAYGRFHAIRERLGPALHLPSPDDLELALMEMEVLWDQQASIDAASLDARFAEIDRIRDKPVRDLLRTRLALMASRAYSIAGDRAAAITVAESALRGWPRRSLPVRDDRLVFDFQLNMWLIAYGALDERRFLAANRWLWERLARTNERGEYDAYAIARFVRLFLELYHEFRDANARRVHFLGEAAYRLDPDQPPRESPIDVQTRIERLREPFLDACLQNLGTLSLDKQAPPRVDLFRSRLTIRSAGP